MQQDIHFLVSGGLVMLPLILCGIISVATMIDRCFAIGAAVTDDRRLVADLWSSMFARASYDAALQACEAQTSNVAKVLASGLRVREGTPVEIERQMEEFALRQMPGMVERLGVLDTIVTIAPLLGLLGTITGMIKAFQIVSTAGVNAPTQITGGIAEALIATATGLTITIFTLPAYNYLTERVRENVSTMEWRATQLHEPACGQSCRAPESPARETAARGDAARPHRDHPDDRCDLFSARLLYDDESGDDSDVGAQGRSSQKPDRRAQADREGRRIDLARGRFLRRSRKSRRVSAGFVPCSRRGWRKTRT